MQSRANDIAFSIFAFTIAFTFILATLWIF